MQFVDWVIKQTGKISDNFNQYKFYVKQEPEIIDSSSVVSLTTYFSRDMTATVPCRFTWFKVRNGVVTEATEFKGNTYICQPYDVGSMIQVQITVIIHYNLFQSLDTECTGTAVLRYGPVKFDLLLKKQIEMALSTGESNFYIDLMNLDTEIQKQCKLKVAQEKITVSHLSSQTSFTFYYSMVEPRIQVMNKMTSQVQIVFNAKYEEELNKFLVKLFGSHSAGYSNGGFSNGVDNGGKFNGVNHGSDNGQNSLQRSKYSSASQNSRTNNSRLVLSLSNRKSRDSLLFICKAFNTKKALKASSYVMSLQKQLNFSFIQQQSTSSKFKSSPNTFQYIQQISQLQNDILKLLEMNSKNYLDKRIYLEENSRLEKEIEEIVGTYVKIIEEKFANRQDFQSSFVMLKDKQEEIKYNKKSNNQDVDTIKHLESENQHLKQVIKNLSGGAHESHNINHLTPNFSRPSQVISGNNHGFHPSVNYSSSFGQSPQKQRSDNYLKKVSLQHPQRSFLKKQSRSRQGSVNNEFKGSVAFQESEQLSQLKKLVRKLEIQKEQVQTKYDNLKNEFYTYKRQFQLKSNHQRRSQKIDNNDYDLDNIDARSVKSGHRQLQPFSKNKNESNYRSSNTEILEFTNNQDIFVVQGQLSQERFRHSNQVKHEKRQNQKVQANNHLHTISLLTQQNLQLKLQISTLQNQLSAMSKQLLQKQAKHKKKVQQLHEQLQMYRRNNDILNRSQHMSMEMDQYNEEQHQTIKRENTYLKGENQTLTDLCRKYKEEVKKYRREKNQVQDSRVLN